MFERLGDLAGVQAGEAASQAFLQASQETAAQSLRAQLEAENQAMLTTAVEIGDSLDIPTLAKDLESTLALLPGHTNLTLATTRHLWTPYVPKMDAYVASTDDTAAEVRAIDLWTVRPVGERNAIPGIAILIYQRSGNYSSESMKIAVTPLKVKNPDKMAYSKKIDLDKLLLVESAMALTLKDLDLDSSLDGKSAKKLAKLDATLRHFIDQFCEPSRFWDEYLGIHPKKRLKYPGEGLSHPEWHKTIINRCRERIRNDIAPKLRKEGLDPDELQPGICQSAKWLPAINELLAPASKEVTTVKGWFTQKEVIVEHAAGAIAKHAIDIPSGGYGIWQTGLQRLALAEQIERALLRAGKPTAT